MPGTLLRVVCSKLVPSPDACAEALGEEDDEPSEEAKEGIKQAAVPCENCVEVGAFHWRWHHDKESTQDRRIQFAIATCVGGMVTALVASAVIVLRLSVVFQSR